MKMSKTNVFVAILLLSSPSLRAGMWEAMRDAWSKINKNTVAVYKRQPALTTVVAATALVSGLGFLLWRAMRPAQVVPLEQIGAQPGKAEQPDVVTPPPCAHLPPAQKKVLSLLPYRFNRKIKIDTLADLPGLFQEELGADHDWNHTAVLFRYEGTLIHDTYNLSNGKNVKLLSYEGEDVNPEIFQMLRQDYGVPDGMTLPMHILTTYGYCAEQQQECDKDGLTYKRKPIYREPREYIEPGIAELTTKGAAVGVYSKNHTLTLTEKQMVEQLGIQVHENNWYNNFLGQMLDSGVQDKHDMFILIDNNQEHITQFLKEGKKRELNALAFFYDRPVPLVTIDVMRAEIRDLDPTVPCYAAGISD